MNSRKISSVIPSFCAHCDAPYLPAPGPNSELFPDSRANTGATIMAVNDSNLIHRRAGLIHLFLDSRNCSPLCAHSMHIKAQ